ncbi:MAG TPA: ABC transporter permease [Trueperaceae bacterium]|nr:ABC transporter permease [Trueperaceae bacterium]
MFRGTLRALRRNPLAACGLVWLIALVILVLGQPYLGLPSPTKLSLSNQFQPPSKQHILGTDESGRDVFSRLLSGGRVSLAVGFAGALLTVLIASVLGLAAGYFGGTIDEILMRLTDTLMAIPTFFLIMVIVAIWGSGVVVLVLALALTRWMDVARLVRAEVLRTKDLEYVSAATALGGSHWRVMFRHLLPQALPSLIVATSLNVGYVMLVEAALSFLGLGVLPPTPSWGNMLSDSQYYVWSAPQLAVYPGVMITLTVLAFNSLGDVLRDLVDPRLSS